MNTVIKMYQPARYRIKVYGAVDKRWFAYYDNMVLEKENEEEGRPLTTITGQVTDQAALLGILNLLYDMQLPLISIKYISGPEGSA